MRILILSRSSELYSTRSLYNAARRRGHFVRVIDHVLCDMYVSNGKLELYFNGQPVQGYDAVIPRIGHTVTQTGASVIRQLASMGVHTILEADALLNARNKLSCLQILSMNGIPVPASLYCNNQYFISELSDKIENFPKIIKLVSGTHGLGVLKADDQKTMESMMEAFLGVRQKILLQEFVKESKGSDVRAFVVDGEVVASMVRQAEEGEFRSNLHRGATATSAQLTDEENECALRAVEIMGLKVAGVDMLRSDRGPLVLEVNTSPGLEGIETVTKVDVSKRIIQYIERSVKNK